MERDGLLQGALGLVEALTIQIFLVEIQKVVLANGRALLARVSPEEFIIAPV